MNLAADATFKEPLRQLEARPAFSSVLTEARPAFAKCCCKTTLEPARASWCLACERAV
jgi:hypothetical protein